MNQTQKISEKKSDHVCLLRNPNVSHLGGELIMQRNVNDNKTHPQQQQKDCTLLPNGRQQLQSDCSLTEASIESSDDPEPHKETKQPLTLLKQLLQLNPLLHRDPEALCVLFA